MFTNGYMGGYGHMGGFGGGYGGGYGMGLIGGILGLIIHLAFAVAVIMVVVWLFKILFRKVEGFSSSSHTNFSMPTILNTKDNAMETLRNRYAKGEINTEEYKKMAAVLENKDYEDASEHKGE